MLPYGDANIISHDELTTAVQHLSSTLVGGSPFGKLAAGFQALVRFLAHSRIEPHDPLLVRIPAYFFEF